MSDETIRIASLPITSNVDGPGRRRVLYVQGCPIHCPGCQSKHLWDEDGGMQYHVEDVAFLLLDDGDGMPVTISGGEPFAQAEAVAKLLEVIRNHEPGLHVIVYTGFVLEDLLEIAEAIPAVLDVLNLADVMVDGPYIQALDHDKMQWRGSANQRPINLRDTVWWETDVVDLVLEDWDTQTIVIDLDGDVIGTAGTMRELFDDSEPTRMCGQIGKNDRQQAWVRGCADDVFGRNSNPYTTGPERRAWQEGHDSGLPWLRRTVRLCDQINGEHEK